VRQVTIHIRAAALQHNLERVKQLAPKSKVVCMVKANAYGIGVQHAVQSFSHADAFGVACLQEALEIRQFCSNKPITLIEGIFSQDEMSIAIAHQCECVIHHQQQLDWLLEHQAAYLQAGLKVWVKLNSGMNRLGFKQNDIIAVIQQLKALGFHCVLTMHFANADEPNHPLNRQQIDQLLQVKQACSPIEISCCNSAAILNWADLHFDYVRPGIMLYGASPFATHSASELGLKSVMQFEAAIIAINTVKMGEHIGYGSTFTASKNMTIAVVSIGYGDGYPRAFVQENFVAIHGKLVPVVGRVSMDMMTIDISDIATEVTLDTPVELWGETRLVDDVATANGTIGYELLCRLTQRPKRLLR
jgi:alanine racemase